MKARYFLIAAIIAALFGGFQILSHQSEVNSRVSTIKTKDRSGLDTTADQAALQNYVNAHIATSANIFLEGSYNRDAQAAQAASTPASNGAIYAQAQAACASKADSIVQSKCVMAYVNSHSAPSTNPQPAEMPDKADYTKSFKSSGFKTDSSGIAFLVALACISIGVAIKSHRPH